MDVTINSMLKDVPMVIKAMGAGISSNVEKLTKS